ncbi:c-type cytochrome [Limimaricola cinnabarinus]|uniref:Cytochrome c4 n=1 Tax=Limimaricola cinnabarinus LL-001 TaxID=1337093 RepID=U3AQQ0_9RHOB|nr:c-type cytochrome [Limimaricola cinnabarinus]GAD57063.1 cytochrome c4 [Limimaricola cinnabarinus LL-001]
MRPIQCAAILAASLLAAPMAHAGDPQLGKQAAGACAACHGRDGIAMAPDAPNLAGQPESYLVEQFLAYRSGERAHEQMTLIAQSVDEAEIEDIAAYFAAIEITATVPDALR